MRNFIIIAAVVVLGILIAIFGFGGDNTNSPDLGNHAPGDSIEGEYSISEIMALGEPYQCLINKSDESGSVEGVVLVSGQNARAFFTLSAANLESSFNSNFIITGGTSYVWTSISPLGFKLPEVKTTDKGASAAEQASILGTEDKEQMKCEVAEPNDDSFKLPAGVSFQEVS